MRKMFFVFVIFVWCFLNESSFKTVAHATETQLTWAKAYGNGWANSVQQTSDGGYVMAGGGLVLATGFDLQVLKLDSNGNIQWQKTYGGADYEIAHSIRQTSDGGYIMTGETYSFGVGGGAYDFWVLKLDSNGNIQWQKTYGGSSYDWPHSIQQTSDGGYVVVGLAGSFGAGAYDFWVLKLDSNGNIQWQKTYGGSGDDRANSVKQTLDGGYIVAGWTSSFGAGSYDFWVLKLDNNGNIQWQKAYGGSNYDFLRSIHQTSDNGYVVAGGTYSFGAGYYADLWVLKLDSNGNIQWQKTYGDGSGSYYANSVKQTLDGGYIVGAAGGGAFLVLKFNSSGDISGCPAGLIKESSAIVTDTNAVITNTNIAAIDTNISPIESNAIAIDASATSSEVCIATQLLQIQIDIKPGSYPNSIKLQDTGNIPVAIFGSSTFDVNKIDVSTLELNGTQVRIVKGKGYLSSYEDVNKDGFMDMVVQFDKGGVQLTTGDTSATVTGKTSGGTAFQGSDSVRVIE